MKKHAGFFKENKRPCFLSERMEEKKQIKN